MACAEFGNFPSPVVVGGQSQAHSAGHGSLDDECANDAALALAMQQEEMERGRGGRRDQDISEHIANSSRYEPHSDEAVDDYALASAMQQAPPPTVEVVSVTIKGRGMCYYRCICCLVCCPIFWLVVFGLVFWRFQGVLMDMTPEIEIPLEWENIAHIVLDKTNEYRKSKGLPEVEWNSGIASIHNEHAEEMATKKAEFNHDGFDGRSRAYPFFNMGASENIAVCPFDVDHNEVATCVINGWINSQEHEQNLRGSWNVCGIGIALRNLTSASVGSYFFSQGFSRKSRF